MEVKVGMRVVRGPDWKWGAQDGGEGHVGTVVEARTADTPEQGHVTARAVLVYWDNGSRCNYRCGIEGKYDLLLLDNGPVAVCHQHIICDSCRENGIQGMRWKCIKCFDFDLCTSCYMSGKHSMEHEFMRQDTPESPRVRLPMRGTSTRLVAKGLFKGAEVVRGYDWLWGDQDGGTGSRGQLTEVRGWEKDTFRSVAEVEWSKGGKKNVYRIGHKGKIDIKAVTPGEGGFYYPDHLPVLGKPVEESTTEEKADIASGDLVRVQLEVDVFKAMQQGHGGWNDQMVELIAQVGTVQSVLDSGDIRVRYPNNRTWTLNVAAVTKVTQFSVGDVVRIIDDIAMVHDLQEGHGGWVDDMALSLGQAGRVIKVFPSGDVRASVNRRNWTFNPLCLKPAPGENPPEAAPEEDMLGGDMDLQLRLLSMLENPAVVVAAAASGDVSTLRDFLTKHPSEVNAMAAGKAALHCAAVAGNTDIIKCLLEFNPNLEIEDDDGDKPLHLCAYGDEDEAAALLIDKGAKVNAKNKVGATPINIAAIKGNISALKVFVSHPDIDLSNQDGEGNTPLHCAVLAQKNEAVSILLEAGADPELVNFRLFTPIHESARIGFLPAMEQFLRQSPNYANLKKDDGYTALHLASLNDHLDIVTTLAENDACDINALTNALQTPLHVAVHQGHSRIVERLVGFGANLNVQDHDGDTPLHYAMIREVTEPISSDTPHIKKVLELLQPPEGESREHTQAAVACFLVQEGADLYIHNNKGLTPLTMCSASIVTIVTKYVDQKTSQEESKYHGSLRRSGAISGLLVPTRQATLTSGAPKPPPAQMDITNPIVSVPKPRLPPVSSEHHSKPNIKPLAVECLLCEKEVDVELLPCGHTVICRLCSERAKKCPECKTKVEHVKDIPPFVPNCLMCEEEPATVTVFPCQHCFCPACSIRMKKKCAECKQVIESKAGMPEETQAGHSQEPTISSSLTLCEICCENRRDTALTCGHQFCLNCSQKVDVCPICRKVIQHRIQLFQ